jgi:methyltransferase (TIGR00027 family)
LSDRVNERPAQEPDNTAVRVALWRALHLEIDPPPHVFEDRVGLELAAPEGDWRSRPDMSPFTRPFRASIVARARFIEDLVAAEAARGVVQYVILGAGLDTFAQRRPEIASRLRVFEIDQPGAQNGSAGASSRSASASRRSCGSCRSTSRPATRGGSA